MNVPDIEALLASQNWEVRASAALRSDLTLDHIARLLDDTSDLVRKITADLHRDLPTEMIQQILTRRSADAPNYAYTATAPAEALGHKIIGMAAESEIDRFLSHEGATSLQRTTFVSARQENPQEMVTLRQLWARVIALP